MLYLSKRVGNDKFGITDTDDNTETVVCYRDLVKTVRLGIEIQGVETEWRNFRGEQMLCIKRTTVQQNEAYLTTKQVKTKALKGVDVIVSGDEITSINWDDRIVKAGTRIRLSDYGSKCADSILFIPFQEHTSRIIIVLDDKVRIKKNTFHDACRTKAQIDLSEVTNQRHVKFVYDEWIENGRVIPVDEFVIDDPVRMEKHEAIGVVCTGENFYKKKFSAEASAGVELMFYGEFDRIAKSQLHYVSGFDAKQRAKDHIRIISKDVYFWRGVGQEYRDVRYRDDLDIFSTLMAVTTCNPQMLFRFKNYLQFFEPSERMKEIYVDFCVRANCWLLDLAREYHWRAW